MISDLQRPTNSGFGQKTEPSEILNNINLDNKKIKLESNFIYINGYFVKQDTNIVYFLYFFIYFGLG